MIAGQVFGMPESHVMEVLRRIREQDLYVRETRSISNRPKATPRHLANLVGALMSGASSRGAAQAVQRMEFCTVNTHYFYKFFRTTEVRLWEEINLFFDNKKWASSRIDRSGARAPLARFVDIACDKDPIEGFSILDLIEVLIEALSIYPELYGELADTEIVYNPDRNDAKLYLVASEWDSEISDYVPKERKTESGYVSHVDLQLDFSDDDNDFQGLVDRRVTVNFEMLHRFAKSLRRGEA